jgi:hypothetical protein
MKKAFLKALWAAALMAAAAASLNAQTTSDGLRYVRNGQGITITGYTGTARTLVIPAKIEGLPVTAIGEMAFYESRCLTSVTSPAALPSSGVMRFLGAAALPA